MVRKSFYIKEQELAVLLAGRGLRTWYSLGSPEEPIRMPQTREDLNRQLLGLYQRGYIDWQEDAVRVREPLSRILPAIERAGGCILCRRERDGETELFYPAGSQVITVERSGTEAETLRLGILTDREWLQEFRERGIFPREDLMTEEELPGEQVRERAPEVTLSLLRLSDGSCRERMELREAGVTALLRFSTPEGEREELFQGKRCDEILLGWLRKAGRRGE